MPHKLLLADDSVTIQRVIELTFADEDVAVVAVGDGQRAIERIKADPPDIVLADTGMPERDGYEVAAFVKADPSLSHIPVVLLTGAFEPLDEQRARRIGCNGVLVKPFEPHLVISRVRELLAAGPATRPQESTATPAREPTPVSQAEAAAASADAAPLSASPLPAASLDSVGLDALATASVDDYFDRLDEAFSSLDAGRASSGSSAAEAADAALPAGFGASSEAGVAAGTAQAESDFGDWDLDVSAAHPFAPALPAPTATPALPAASHQAAPPLQATESPKAVAPPPIVPSGLAEAAPLASAFAALLAVEQGAPATLTAWPAEPRAAITDELVEELTRRVLERLTERTVRVAVAEVVTDIAERLVRKEIERIKAGIK